MLGLSWGERAPLLLRPNDNPKNGPPRLAHLLASQYYECHYISRELYDRYFVFSFVRNPWDRVVSFYRYLGFSSKISLEEFVLNHLVPAVESGHWFVRPQVDFIVRDGKLMVDYVGRFESLQADFGYVMATLGLPPVGLPRINQSSLECFKEIAWTDAAVCGVDKVYHQDVSRFGYQAPKVTDG